MMYINEEDMPEHCPPLNAKSEKKDDVFRFLTEKQPKEVDFHNHLKRNLRYGQNKKCEAIALSFFTAEEMVTKMRRKFPVMFKNAEVLKGNICEHYGVHSIKNQHMNLWVFHGINMFLEFTKVEEVGR